MYCVSLETTAAVLAQTKGEAAAPWAQTLNTKNLTRKRTTKNRRSSQAKGMMKNALVKSRTTKSVLVSRVADRRWTTKSFTASNTRGSTDLSGLVVLSDTPERYESTITRFLTLSPTILVRTPPFRQNRLLAQVILNFFDRIEGFQKTSTVKVGNLNLRNLILVNSSIVCEPRPRPRKDHRDQLPEHDLQLERHRGRAVRRLSQQEHRNEAISLVGHLDPRSTTSRLPEGRGRREWESDRSTAALDLQQVGDLPMLLAHWPNPEL